MGVRNRQRKKSMKTLVLPLLMVHLCSALTGSHVKVSIGGVSYSHGNKVDSPFHNSFPALKTKTVASLNASQNQASSSRVNTPPTSPVPMHVTPAAPATPTTPTTPTSPTTPSTHSTPSTPSTHSTHSTHTTPTTPTIPTSTIPTPTEPTHSPSTLAKVYFTSSPFQQPETARVHKQDAPHSRITPIFKTPEIVYKSSIRIISIPETTIAQASQTASKFELSPKFHGALQYQSTPETLQQTRKARLLKMLELFQNKSQTRRTLSKNRKTHKYKTTLKYKAELDYTTTPKYNAAQKYNTTPKHTAELEYNTISFNKAEPEYQTTPQPKQQTRKTRLEKMREIFKKYLSYNQLKNEDK